MSIRPRELFLYAGPRARRFPLEALNVVDFVSFLPLFVSSSDYSFLRLLRVLRLQRLLTDVETFAEVRLVVSIVRWQWPSVRLAVLMVTSARGLFPIVPNCS